jgi:hypothetical protein
MVGWGNVFQPGTFVEQFVDLSYEYSSKINSGIISGWFSVFKWMYSPDDVAGLLARSP